MTNKIFNYSINNGFLWSEVNLKGEKQYFIEGYASTIDEDKAGEIIDMSAQQDILNQIQNENITMDIEHEEWYDDNGKMLQRPRNEKIPVAKIVSAELRERGVWVKAQINTNLGKFNEVWGSIKDGFLKAFSVAFYPVQKASNVIKRLNLVNVTLTGSPVNPRATFAVSMKSAAAWMDTQEIKMEENTMVEEVKPAEPVVEEPVVEEPKPAEPVVEEPVVESPMADIKAEITALKEKYDAAIKAQSDEIARLKAELDKPVMKATVEKVMPKDKPAELKLSPLQMVR